MAADWRFKAIFCAWLVSVLLTLAIAFWGYNFDLDAPFWASVFTSWVAGVTLFTVVGGVVAGVSLVLPEKESFDTRARILFRRQSGLHIDYIVLRIKGDL